MTFTPDKNRIALGIKQPWAELILRGEKRLEIRSRPTNVRGPIYLYTSRKIASESFAVAALERFELSAQDCPTGLIVGEVTISECRPATSADSVAACVPEDRLVDQYAWVLSDPVRLPQPQPVRFLPYGVWFYPYQRRQKT